MAVPEPLNHRARIDRRTTRDQQTRPHHSDNMIEFMAITLIARPSPESRTIRHEE
ncbi:hypothetical protein ACFU8Q_30290 [Streptomyces sp. NPDC057543]|uniref:hypothetical protein n=1 Tax=Streptomyces sp. NPDC057543 TaxID=3346163 RepID=UPI0036CFAEEE